MICVCVHAYTHTHTHVRVCVCVCKYIRTHCMCTCLGILTHIHMHVQEKMKTCTSAKKIATHAGSRDRQYIASKISRIKANATIEKINIQGKIYRSDILPSISRTKANATTEKITLMLPWLRVTIIAHAIMKMPPKIKRSDRKISQRKSWSRLIVSAQSWSESTQACH